MAGRLQIAVLDDYQGLSAPHFQTLDPTSSEVTVFSDTLLPYNHPATPQDVKDQLVKRLEPFAVICTPIVPSRLRSGVQPANPLQAP